MESILIGYVAKRLTPPPQAFQPASVTEIASVSNCIAERPLGWMQEWKHNDWCVYDTPEIARQIAERCGSFGWPVVAYRLLPVRFDPDRQVHLEVAASAVPIPPYFQRLGWDVVSRSITPEFECSPLSCNGLAAELAVNDACLLSSCEAAIAFAQRCAREQPEPGAYFVVEVWRELIAA